jgi:hypothetical protein
MYLHDDINVDLLCLCLGFTLHVGPCLPPAPRSDFIEGRSGSIDVAFCALFIRAIELLGKKKKRQ